MSDNDHDYYLKRALFHRRQLVLASCAEARLCHVPLVKAYQRRLAEIRSKRATNLEHDAVAARARGTLSLFGSSSPKTRLNETC